MTRIVQAAALFFLTMSFGFTQSLSDPSYDIGTINVTDYYVDPANGNDGNTGTSRSAPKRTVQDIWNSIPESSNLSKGYRINLLSGTYTTDHLPNYWELKRGTSSTPIILQSADGYGSVFFTRDINMANVSYFYLLGIDIKNKTNEGYGDAFHCESCDHILLRGNNFNGAPNGRKAGGDIAHETVKFNQSQYVYIENNNIQGADDNAIDWVAVQYGHIKGNRIHDTDGWCMYVKGGSSYILVESNIAYECGEGGITAGQGTGFEFMQNPWLRYEANYIKVVNNIIYNIEGAALGVNGGYGILMAYNTAYHVGARSHLIEVVFGERSCDGDTAACASRLSQGGWGPQSTGSNNAQYIGNRDVTIANNVVYNPPGFSSGSQHFAIYGPRTPTVSGIPSPQVTDANLIIKGNVIWNGPGSMPLGIEGENDGCQSGNATCNAAQLMAENRINSTEPDFVNYAGFDFRPSSGGALSQITSSSIANFGSIDTSNNPISEGNLSNQMVREFSGASVTERPPGAFAGAASSVDFPVPGDGGSTPGGNDGNGGNNAAPTVTKVKASAERNGKMVNVNVSCVANDDSAVTSVKAIVSAGEKVLKTFNLALKKGRYSVSKSVKTKAKNLSISIEARDAGNLTGTATKSVKVK